MHLCKRLVCECMSVSSVDGSHIIMNSLMVAPWSMGYIWDSSRPKSPGVSPRDNPSKMTLSVPGIWTVSATVASKWTEMVV